MKYLQALLNSAGFITVVPLPWFEDVPWSMAFAMFPVVGLLLGLTLCLLGFLPHPLAPAAVVLAWVVITGAFHLDGLADSFDALSLGGGREERLSVMKDPRVGAFGTVSVALVLVLKLWFAAYLSPLKLVLPPVLGRLSLLLVAAFSPPAKSEGLGAMVKSSLTVPCAAFALLFSLLVSAFFGVPGLVCFAFCVVFCYFFSRMWMGKIGGFTGDVLGAACEITETVVMAILTLGGTL